MVGPLESAQETVAPNTVISKKGKKKVTGFYDVVIKIFGYVSAWFVILSTLTIAN